MNRRRPKKEKSGKGKKDAHSNGRRGRSDRHSKGAAKASESLTATVDKKAKGFAFLVFDNREFEDLYISRTEAKNLFQSDRVEVAIAKSGEVLSIDVIERRFKEVIGQFQIDPDNSNAGWVISGRKRSKLELFISKLPESVPEDGTWVKVKIDHSAKGNQNPEARIIQSLGTELKSNHDLELISLEYNIYQEHPDDVIAAAERLRLNLDVELKNRKDFRPIPFITIDGEDARDFDDAIHVETTSSGFKLWVAIADVSHYVSPGSIIDKEAYSRGTSAYFPECAFHMLPRNLSENLCSLRPDEPRLALTAEIDFDKSGTRKGTKIHDSIIESKRRATYKEIQDEIDSGSNAGHFKNTYDLFQALAKARTQRGSIDFNLPEPKVFVDESGEPQDIAVQTRLEAHRIIEEFMIAANEAVTDWALHRNLPFIYRVHESPKDEDITNFTSLCRTAGINLSLPKGALRPKDLAEAINKITGHQAELLLNTALLRSMSQAIYSNEHGEHFGLASPAYTHFTSPIRRYPDLVVHRILKSQIQKEKRSGDLEKIKKTLKEVTSHCSYRERLAAGAEREMLRIKQVRLLEKHLGQEFDGTVVGIIESGLFIQVLSPFFEGFASTESLEDDIYVYHESRMMMHGTRTKRRIQIGDKITAQVTRVDLINRQIDLRITTRQN